MKKWLFALPVLGTIIALCLNKEGFWVGGPREWWELAVSLCCITCWVIFFRKGGPRWQMLLSRIWWGAVTLCAAVCFCVTAFHLDGFLLILPAIVFVTPLSGLAFLTGTVYPVFYAVCTTLAATFTRFTFGGKKR